jgi:hypothetical protein
MSDTSERESSPSTLSSVAIPVRRTAEPDESMSAALRRRLVVSSSGLLRRFALALWSAKILQPCAAMLPGLGRDSDPNWRRWITASCPSDCEPVALGLTIDGIGCSCSVSAPTPCARDWKDGTSAVHASRHYRRNITEKRGAQFPRWVAFHYGLVPGPRAYEVALGFPEDWTAVAFERSGTRSSRKSRNGSQSKSEAPRTLSHERTR